MIQKHIQMLKDALIAEFYDLYEQHAQDGIYACALVITPYLILDDLAISTRRSLFSDSDEPIQYLSKQDQWQVSKWRYRSHQSNGQLQALKQIFAEYFQQTHIFGQPTSQQNNYHLNSNLEIFIEALAQAKMTLSDQYGLELDQILFFISIPNQPKVEILSAQQINSSSSQLVEFIKHKTPHEVHHINAAAAKIKPSQADKDLLTDLAQITLIEPYDYLNVAHEAYLLTLDPHFVDANIYVQKLIQNIAAMDAQKNGTCAFEREDILLQIQRLRLSSDPNTVLLN